MVISNYGILDNGLQIKYYNTKKKFVILRIKYKFFERKHKYIKTYGPLIRYQAYLWYQPNELKTNNNYLYELDIIN